MCLHVRRLLCCPATITWPADLIFPPIQALGVPDVEGIVPRLKLAWVGPPSVKFGIHKSNVIFSGNWKGILKLHYSLVHVWCKEHFKSFVPWLVTLSWIWDTLASRRSIWRKTFIIKHKIKYPRPASIPQCVFVNYEYDGVMVGIREALIFWKLYSF